MLLEHLGLRISNRRTPSAKMPINSLPFDILNIIFRNYCQFDDEGPLLLLYVCTLWRNIVNDCPVLWGKIVYIPGFSAPRDPNRILFMSQYCHSWWAVQRFARRAQEAVLDLNILPDNHSPFIPADPRGPTPTALFGRCRSLTLNLCRGLNSFVLNETDMLPALEHLNITYYGETGLEEFFQLVEIGSPRLRSLRLAGTISSRLEYRRILLGRTTSFYLTIAVMPSAYERFFLELKNLKELTTVWPIDIPPLAFQQLVSLTLISGVEMPLDQEDAKFNLPMLDNLDIRGYPAYLLRISAPKLSKLSLRPPKNQATIIPILRRATVLPTSLAISDSISSLDLMEILEDIWPGLINLHLTSYEEASFPDRRVFYALAGSPPYRPICPNLGYFTITKQIDEIYSAAARLDPAILNLKMVVDQRRGYEDMEIKHVRYFWEYRRVGADGKPLQGCPPEVEWIDII